MVTPCVCWEVESNQEDSSFLDRDSASVGNRIRTFRENVRGVDRL
jgi:hypothetical protein